MDRDLVGHGFALVIVTYTPDGIGSSGEEQGNTIWKVEASEDQITQSQVNIAKFWWEYRDDFIDQASGLVNEKAFVPFIAETLGIPKDDVLLPLVVREPVPYRS